MLKTHIAFCIDESGSVAGIVKPLVDAYNNNVNEIKSSVLDSGQEATMTALAFGHVNLKHRQLYVGQQVQTVVPLKHTDLMPSGQTPMFDSIYRAIKKLEEFDDGKSETSFVVSIVTDGEENSSFDPGPSTTLAEISKKINTDRWTFTFLIPHSHIRSFMRRYSGIPQGNIQGWDEKTAKGAEVAFIATSVGYKNYFSGKSKGLTSTRSFYSDLSNVTVREARSELSKITNQVQFIKCYKNETLIRDLVEKAGKEYIKGAAFYQLVKTEKKVQPYKLICLRVKSSGEVYCGQEARVMLGIDVPNTVRLVPGDHAKFDVFIQSTSYTRKIPAGTEVLYWPKFGTQKK